MKRFICVFLFAIFAITRRIGIKVRFRVLFPLMGPIFVKIGQMLSTRVDLFDEDIINDLVLLQDRIPQFSSEKALEIINRAFPGCFSYISQDAISSASVAQVHKAVLCSGEMVAIKILRPGIKKKFADDIRFIRGTIAIMSFLSRRMRRLELDSVITRFERGLLIELNLLMEAANASVIRDHIHHEPEVYLPQIYWDFSNENILTMEWIDGCKITEAPGDRQRLAEDLITIFIKQIYRDGIFHADIHPANVLVRNGNICLIDFGIVGRLSVDSRRYLTEIFRGFLEGDYELVADVHFRAGYVARDYHRFVLACKIIGQSIANKKSSEVKFGEILKKLFNIMSEFDMKAQEELLLFQKTIVMLEGVLSQLDPDINIWNVARPFIIKWSLRDMSIIEKICVGLSSNARISSSLKSILRKMCG